MLLCTLLFLLSGSVPNAQAGVFNIPRFLPPGDWAVGIEPELTLTGGAGLAVNGRGTYGLSDFSDVHVILGAGGGARGTRFGGAMTFDFIPDIEKQPGLGVAAQLLYVNTSGTGGLELTGIPYVHKSFVSGTNEFDPFLAIPVGVAFLGNGTYRGLTSMVIGSSFKANDRMRYILEVGVAISNTQTYFSGGLTYSAP